MRDVLAGVILFIIFMMFMSAFEEQWDRLNDVPSGTVILSINRDAILGRVLVYKTPNGNVERQMIYHIALMRSDGTFYSVGDTINHYNIYGEIIK